MSASKNKVTLAQARKVLQVVDAGLSNGLGEPVPGQMCVEAAVCFALGQPHGDEPACVNSAVRSFKIKLNDANWSSNAARAKGMRAIAIAQLGTKDDSFDEQKFAQALVVGVVNTLLPISLLALVDNPLLVAHKDALVKAANECSAVKAFGAAESAASAAWSAASAAESAAWSAAWSAAESAARSAARSAAWSAAESAASAAESAARSAARSAAESAAWSAASAENDRVLGLGAQLGVTALRIAGAAGIVLMDKLLK